MFSQSGVTRSRTVIVIAHRQSTIMAADRLVVMADGKVVEVGTYGDLSYGDGHFAKLCRLHEDALL